MKTFLKIFGGFILLIIIGGLILDNKVNVSREVIINASPEEIHAFVNDLNEWPEWSPWTEMDPTIKTTIGNISSGIGASQFWRGESGNGSLTFTQSSLEGVTYNLNFEGDPGVYIGKMIYQVEGNATKVTWSMTGTAKPIIIGNYFAQIMDSLVGDSFSLGLNKLKKIAEDNDS